VAEVSQSEFDWPMSSTCVSTMGGVMTEEAGAITGELELLTRVSQDDGVKVLVRYAVGARSLHRFGASRPSGAPRGPRAHLGGVDDAGEDRERQRTASGPVGRLNLSGLPIASLPVFPSTHL
jgi:hypothetical protein